jgi:hypothetical protein
MLPVKCRVLLAVCSIAFTGLRVTAADLISGASVMKLDAPATAEIRAEALSAAADSLGKSLYNWLQKNNEPVPDLSNPVRKHFFTVFTRSCIQRARQDSYFEGYQWVLNIDIKEEDAKDALAKHNAWCDSIAQTSWKTAQQSIQTGQYASFYDACVHSTFYSMGKVGHIPPDTDIEHQARTALQKFLDRLHVSYSQPIIKGKPGEVVELGVEITTKVDDTPFPGLHLLARLPDGTKVTNLTTDADGRTALSAIKMPFVAYGTFLHVVINFGATINPAYVFEAPALGLHSFESQDQTLIFNTIKPVYTLSYQAVAANKVSIPADFSSDTWIRKFIEDSCHMKRAAGDAGADLILRVRCQVSSYVFDEREETELKVESLISIKQTVPGGNAIERSDLVHQKSYDTNQPIPSGQFFWETTTQLKALLKQILAQL